MRSVQHVLDEACTKEHYAAHLPVHYTPKMIFTCLIFLSCLFFFFFSSRRRHTRFDCDWSSDVCSSDLEAYAQGYLGKNILGSGCDLDMHVVIGAGAYICGEETALLESLEGRKGYPRLKPPFPANAGGGLFRQPTAVNNVETLANLPVIVEKGGEWFADVGVPKNGGTRLYAVSGHVMVPGVHEAPMGTTFRVLLDEHCGGMRGNKKLKAIIPGGSSSAVMTAEEVDWPSDFDTLKAKKTMAGSGGVVYLDEDTNMAFALANVMRFYAHESCGQCTPCREGTAWLGRLLDKICAGRGEKLEVDNVHQIARPMEMENH